jgi:hypothetical protein
VEQREHTASEAEILQIDTKEMRKTALHRQAGEKGWSGSPTAIDTGI